MSRSILVIGTHRSGTSAVAGVLHTLGVHMGSRMLGPSDANPRGHFEDMEFLMLNDRVVKDWRSPAPEPTPADLGAYANLAVKRSIWPLWGIKDPRLCFTARYVLPHLDDPMIVLTHRAEDACIQSLMKRDGMAEAEAEAITTAYLEARWELLQEFDDVPWHNVWYEDLVQEPADVVEELALAVLPTERAAAFVDASLDRCG